MAHRMKRVALFAIVVTAFWLPVVAGGQTVINWWSIDSGGEVFASGGDWVLSATVGQSDSSEGNLLVGGQWQMTGGFWAIRAPSSDILFLGDFED